MNTDFQALEWGTVVSAACQPGADRQGRVEHLLHVSRRLRKHPSPAPNITFKSSSTKSNWFGWPTDEKMEELRAAWYDAEDEAAQKALCEAMQVEFWKSPPYAPLSERRSLPQAN